MLILPSFLGFKKSGISTAAVFSYIQLVLILWLISIYFIDSYKPEEVSTITTSNGIMPVIIKAANRIALKTLVILSQMLFA
jgi:hypothetical protein